MKLFVWDFHGVLEKDNDLAVLDISNSILALHGYEVRLSEADVRAYYGLKWYEYFEKVLPGLEKEAYLALQAECFEFDNKNIVAKYIKPTDHALEVLRTIKDNGHDQILLSNTRPYDLDWFVALVGMEKYFTSNKLFGVNAHQTHSNKSEALKEYINDKTFDKVVIIGDSESDMALKEVTGGVTYFYSHPQLELNTAVKADYVITDLREILNEL
jgi:phosphoglycolate phosphatase-like HAD superfamily hydrolase